jgi:hypothetical protein
MSKAFDIVAMTFLHSLLHNLILRTTAAFRYSPIDVFVWHFDTTAFAVDAILSVDDKLFSLVC